VTAKKISLRFDIKLQPTFMNNYDFLNLSPSEFELLARDRLQAHLAVLIEILLKEPIMTFSQLIIIYLQ